jgi:ABC-type branched-subunit amino acid transport system ATPase component
MSDPIVSLSGLTRRIADVTAFEDLSFEIRPAETVALLGPNGAGKTTALEVRASTGPRIRNSTAQSLPPQRYCGNHCHRAARAAQARERILDYSDPKER